METCPNVGFELWQARKARGLSRAELSSLTKLRIGQIEAFEGNDLQALPPTFFVRRHLHLYASELGLNGDQVVRRYLSQFNLENDDSVVTEPRSTPFIQTPTRSMRIPLARVAMLAIIVLVGLLFVNAPAALLGRAPTSHDGPAAVPAVSVPLENPGYATVVARSRSIATSARLAY